MNKILIVNGPNLNLLGKREIEIYGSQSFDDFFTSIREEFAGLQLYCFQTNHEGEIIDKIHEWGFLPDAGIVLNAGAYTHTSVAIRDAITAVDVPVAEVHISDIYAREPFRKVNFLKEVCVLSVIGQGLNGYRMAIRALLSSNP